MLGPDLAAYLDLVLFLSSSLDDDPTVSNPESTRLGRAALSAKIDHKLRIFIGSWNMNGKTCNDHDMASWLTVDSFRAVPVATELNDEVEVVEQAQFKTPPDVVVVGCQEFVALNAQAMLPFSAKYPKQALWRCLGARSLLVEGYGSG